MVQDYVGHEFFSFDSEIKCRSLHVASLLLETAEHKGAAE
jgi:hypothetical protein